MQLDFPATHFHDAYRDFLCRSLETRGEFFAEYLPSAYVLPKVHIACEKLAHARAQAKMANNAAERMSTAELESAKSSVFEASCCDMAFLYRSDVRSFNCRSKDYETWAFGKHFG